MSFLEKLAPLAQKERAFSKKAWERLCQEGLPDRQTPHYKYIRLNDLYALPERSIESASPKEESALHFVDGIYQPALSTLPKGVVALPLSEASLTYRNFLEGRWSRSLEEERDPFALMNSALFKEGLFLYLPPNKVLETPLKIVHQEHLGGFSAPRIHLFAGKGASATLHVLYQTKGVSSSYIDCALEAQAHIRVISLFEEESTSWHLHSLRGSLKKESLFDAVSITNGSATLRQDYHLSLLEEGGSASLQGVWKLKERNQSHVNVLMDHRAPFCTSYQKFKGVLYDQSRSSFEGKIFVRQKAQKTEAYQMNPHLVLSPLATAYSRPNLEIFADDVKASHGSTVGQIDREQLFYLQSRGIPPAQAESVLVNGFTREVLALIQDSVWRARAEALL